MKIQLLSDLHREFGPAEIPRKNVDLIALAGDISTKLNGLEWIRDFVGTTPCVYICGNHEFYGDKLPRISEKIEEATSGSNIHFLENRSFTIGDWNIFGATLWTDMNLTGDIQFACETAAECMNDYKRIRNSANQYRKLTPTDTSLIHAKSVSALTAFFSEHDPSKSIVVSHHAPSPLSLPERRRAMTISCAYASDLTDLIVEHQPAHWFHGHIHQSVDYQIGKTRIRSNPQGYPDEINPNFDPGLIIEV